MMKRSRLAAASLTKVLALSATLFVGAACVAVPAGGQMPVRPPTTGKGYLFSAPRGNLALRIGYSRANANSDVFDVERQQFTIGPRGFDAMSYGVDLGYNLTRRFDVGLTIDGTTRSTSSAYRDWLDNNDQPITQRTSLNTIGVSTNLRYNFLDRGRAISNFAWIPAHYVPYVGVGGGILHYSFNQKGDFIDFQTNAVNPDELNAANWAAMAQAFSGLSYSVTPQLSLLTEARYTFSSGSLNKDYSELGRIDLSGLSLNFGTSIRF